MIVKENWTEQDFDEMGWHDSAIYNLSFPQDNQDLVLDIDYIFEWILNEDTNLFSFQVAPCILTFKYVLDLKIMLDLKDPIGIYILKKSHITS